MQAIFSLVSWAQQVITIPHFGRAHFLLNAAVPARLLRAAEFSSPEAPAQLQAPVIEHSHLFQAGQMLSRQKSLPSA